MNVAEIVKETEKYKIVKLYANVVHSKENDVQYYKDIYLLKEDVLNEHPQSEVVEGFGIVDVQTGYIPESFLDWFESLDDALFYIEENQTNSL